MRIQINEDRFCIGKRYGMLTVKRRSPDRGNGNNTLWECLCDCGQICAYRKIDLEKGKRKSCGCNHRCNGILMKGERVGVFKIIRRKGADSSRRIIWECLCDCGKIELVRGADLRRYSYENCRHQGTPYAL